MLGVRLVVERAQDLAIARTGSSFGPARASIRSARSISVSSSGGSGGGGGGGDLFVGAAAWRQRNRRSPASGGVTIAGLGGTAIAGLIGMMVAVSGAGVGAGFIGALSPVNSSQLCDASPQLRPNFRSTRIGTSSETASQPSCATSSACSRVRTEQSRQSCIWSSGTMPSRQQARIQSLVCRAAVP